MKLTLRKQMIAGAIATLLAAPAWSTSTANDPAKNRTGAQTGSEMRSDTQRSGSTGTTQSGSAYGSGTGTTSGAAGAGTAATATGSTSPSMGAGTGRINADNPLYARTVDELEGTDVVDAAGNEIGEIEHVVLTQDRRSAHAVVSVGGFLGIGDRDIVVSLDELRPAGDGKLQLNATKDDLKARPEYRSEQYVEVEGDQPLSGSITDFAAFETDRDRSTGMSRDSDASGSTTEGSMRQAPSGTNAAPGTTGRAPSSGGRNGGAAGSGAAGSGATR